MSAVDGAPDERLPQEIYWRLGRGFDHDPSRPRRRIPIRIGFYRTKKLGETRRYQALVSTRQDDDMFRSG